MGKRSDFERVLMNIAVDTSGSFCDKMMKLANGWTLRYSFGEPAPQFVPLELAKVINMPLKKGDIVRCKTNPNHHWGISVYIEGKQYHDFLLQEIGGKALLRMSNEDFEVLRFMVPERLYTGHQYQVYIWASRKAFSERYNKNADYYKRCGRVEFEEDNLIIWCRAHICTMEGKGENGETTYAQPKKFTMKWNKKTRLKDIISVMDEQGFNSEFEYTTEKPIEGQAGCVTITRDDLVRVFNERQ